MQTQSLPKVKTIDKYNVQYQFQGGAQGEVYLSSHQKGLFAIKIPSRQFNPDLQLFMKENLYISKLCHPHIVKLIEYKPKTNVVFEDKTLIQCPMTVLQFAQQGDLFQYSVKKSYSQPVCALIFKELIDAMKYCHYEKKVMHLDMKLENILLTHDYHLKITDFGHAKFYEDLKNQKEQKSFSYGTDWLKPPECENIQMFNGEKVDVFNCGLVLFKLLTRTYPIRTCRIIRKDPLYNQLSKGRFKQFWNHFDRLPKINLSNSVKRLLSSMLHPDPQKRATFEQISQDKWFKSTPAASQKQLREQFQEQKRILLRDSNTKQCRKKLQQIKNLYQTINRGPTLNNQELTARSKSQSHQEQLLIQYYNQLVSSKDLFKNLIEKNKYGVRYCKYKPEFIAIYLKKQIEEKFRIKALLLDDIFGCFEPEQYGFQLFQKLAGVIKCRFYYKVRPGSVESLDCSVGNEKQQVLGQFQSNSIEQQVDESSMLDQKQEQANNQSNSSQKAHHRSSHSEQSQSQQEYQQIRIQIYGQFLKFQQNYGIDWELKEKNQDDCWSRQLIFELKKICQLLDARMGQSEQNQNKRGEETSLLKETKPKIK